MERLGKEAIILTNKEFETIRKYKKIEELAKIEKEEEEKKENIDNLRLILFIFVPIALFTLINFVIICKIYELLQNINIIA